MFVWIVKPQWKKILVTKCAISLKLAILLSRNKIVYFLFIVMLCTPVLVGWEGVYPV